VHEDDIAQCVSCGCCRQRLNAINVPLVRHGVHVAGSRTLSLIEEGQVAGSLLSLDQDDDLFISIVGIDGGVDIL
jgi:hypothetical protein